MKTQINEAWADMNASLMQESLAILYPNYDMCMPLEWENSKDDALTCHANLVNTQHMHLLIMINEDKDGNIAVYQRELAENDPEYQSLFVDEV